AQLRDTQLVQTLAASIQDEFLVNSKRLSDLELVLTEVITNSIDHGILELDSTIKKDPSGFERFFVTRAAKLAELSSGYIEVSIDQPDHGAIRMVVKDSGGGFPYPTGQLSQMPDSLLLAYGRGLLIIQQLCLSVTHIGNGNCVVLEFSII
ncbi:MAG: ATP-binding protein, partial [Pseudomonadota bacterium]